MFLGFFKARRRKKLLKRAIPTAWVEHLRKNCAFFEKLDAPTQQKLLGFINVFLDEKSFEGCGGLLMTDEVRVTIAAQACLLILNQDTQYYPRLRTILVYPSTYQARSVTSEGGFEAEGQSARLGESWGTGSVVLAWDAVVQGGHNRQDGLNVVYHEFAHQLDQVNGSADGLPQLGKGISIFDSASRDRLQKWAVVMSEEYENLCSDEDKGRKTLLDKYGTTNPAEFFSVATESFFERSRTLARKHPELYEQLKMFYRQDPATW